MNILKNKINDPMLGSESHMGGQSSTVSREGGVI